MKVYIVCQYCKKSVLKLKDVPIGADLRIIARNYSYDKTERGFRCPNCRERGDNGNSVRV
jgi:DNA-directed RNA polymerase subunit RPC12/RpoP